MGETRVSENRSVNFSYSKYAPKLGDVLLAKDLNNPQVEHPLTIQPPLSEPLEALLVTNWTRSFAKKFEVPQEDNSKEDWAHVSPLDVAHVDFITFFDGVDKINEQANKELTALKKHSFINRQHIKSVESINTHVQKDAERVAKGLVFAVGANVAKNDPRLAETLKRFEANLNPDKATKDGQTKEVFWAIIPILRKLNLLDSVNKSLNFSKNNLT